jgi:hypothetical protein
VKLVSVFAVAAIFEETDYDWRQKCAGDGCGFSRALKGKRAAEEAHVNYMAKQRTMGNSSQMSNQSIRQSNCWKTCLR